MSKKWNTKSTESTFYEFDGVYEEDSQGNVWDDNDDDVNVTFLQKLPYYYTITPYEEEKEKTMHGKWGVICDEDTTETREVMAYVTEDGDIRIRVSPKNDMSIYTADIGAWIETKWAEPPKGSRVFYSGDILPLKLA